MIVQSRGFRVGQTWQFYTDSAIAHRKKMTAPEFVFDKQYYHEQVVKFSIPTMQRLNRFMRFQMTFNLLFLLAGIIEIVIFFSLFVLFNQPALLALTLACFFLTIFSYFIIRLYLQAKKPEQLMELCGEYFDQCKKWIQYHDGVPEHHIAIASAGQKFAAALHEKEYTFYTPPPFLASLTPSLEKFSCLCYWKDLHRMKELLLMTAIDEYLKIVKCEPTNLEIHAALANAYVMLSSLYADPRKYPGFDDERWIPPERYSETMLAKFRGASERAIEEFHILNDYAPDDPWVHIQLAYSYHDLQMPEEEIKEYEIILKLRPNDHDTLFKLGMLYFQQGRNAKGLRIYEILKQSHYKKAESLIKFYGIYDFEEQSISNV